jgi:PAS domain-containing protein
MIKLLNILKEAVTKKYTIFCDMDGVICDFDKQFEKLTGIIPKEYEQKYGIEAFWKVITDEGSEFWSTMEWMPGGKQLWDYIKPHKPILLSAPSRAESSKIGKELWRDKQIPGTKLVLASRQDKKTYADPTHILIDDRKDNIDSWVEAGGIGIQYLSTSQTIEKLKSLGL